MEKLLNIEPAIAMLLSGFACLLMRYFYKRFLEKHKNARVDDKARLLSMLVLGILAIIAGLYRLAFLALRQ